MSPQLLSGADKPDDACPEVTGTPRPVMDEETPVEIFTAFTVWEKRWVVCITAFAGMFSPMSSFIFYPAIESIARSLDATVGLINLAVTTYMVISGVVPAILGNAADSFGRRPVYILALSIYFVANLGLSLQNTYAGLLVLRMIQSAGSSGTISLGYGVISDITERADRGFYVGILLIGPNVAAPTGPILGAALASSLGWKWIFWFLCILGGACLALVCIALPETSRVVVGNGKTKPRGVYRCLLPIPKAAHTREVAIEQGGHKSKFTFPSPVACVKILFLGDVAIVLFCNGIYYMILCCAQATLSTLFIDMYHYSELQAGLIYIPFGLACLLSTMIWGKVLDSDYAHTIRQRETGAETPSGERDVKFPIEKARFRSAYYLVALSTGAFLAYGWVIQHKIHAAVPLVLQAVIGFCGTGLFVAFGTLITDLNANRSSTAAASANLVRCALAATALAVIQPIIDGIGVGWCFTILGLCGGFCAILMALVTQRGPIWRASRAESHE